MKRLLRISIVLSAILLPLYGATATAVPKPDVTISPFLREVRFSANDATKDFDVSITNNSSIIQKFNLSVLDFGSLNDSGGVVFAGTNASKLVKKYGLANWLQLNETEISVEPGKTANIVATIINDATLQPGGHYAAIVAALENPEQSGVNEISINQKLSSLILATKVGGEKYDLSLQNIEAKGSFFALPKTIMLHFKNPGNVHVVPRGLVRIIAPEGNVISQGVINEDSSFMLPETSRKLPVAMQTLGVRSLWPSVYHIQVDYRYDGIEQFAHKTKPIYFINIPGIIASLIVLISVAIIIWKIRHKIKQTIHFARSKIR